MESLHQIQENLAKIHECDQRIAEMEAQRNQNLCDQAEEFVNEENVYLSVLLDELEQQQKIANRLHDQNQKLRQKLQQQKAAYQKLQTQSETLTKEHEAFVAQQRKAFETKQSEEDLSAAREDNRLKQSFQQISDKNSKLLQERNALQEKLNQLKASGSKKKKKKPN